MLAEYKPSTTVVAGTATAGIGHNFGDLQVEWLLFSIFLCKLNCKNIYRSARSPSKSNFPPSSEKAVLNSDSIQREHLL